MTPEQRYRIVAQAPDPLLEFRPSSLLMAREQDYWDRAGEVVRALFSRNGFLAARREGPKRK